MNEAGNLDSWIYSFKLILNRIERMMKPLMKRCWNWDEFSRAITILEMIKRREKTKRELLHLTLEVVEKR